MSEPQFKVGDLVMAIDDYEPSPARVIEVNQHIGWNAYILKFADCEARYHEDMVMPYELNIAQFTTVINGMMEL